jgi:hypothetical protein
VTLKASLHSMSSCTPWDPYHISTCMMLKGNVWLCFCNISLNRPKAPRPSVQHCTMLVITLSNHFNSGRWPTLCMFWTQRVRCSSCETCRKVGIVDAVCMQPAPQAHSSSNYIRANAERAISETEGVVL